MPHNGTVVGSPTFGGAKFGSGLTVVSDSNYVSLPTGTIPTASAAGFSLKIWLKLASAPSSYKTAFTNAGSSPDPAQGQDITIGVTPSGHMYGVACAQLVDSGIAIADGSWHFCELAVSAGGSIKTAVDGVAGATGSGTLASPETSALLGRYYQTGSAWPGQMDEASVWNTNALASSVPTSAYLGTEPGLVAVYHLDGSAADGVVTGITIDPSNAAILYSPFNWSVTGGYARSTNQGAYFRTIFSGTSISITTDSSPNVASYYPQIWVSVDEQPFVPYLFSAGNPTFAVASGLPNRKHSLEVVVKFNTSNQDRWGASPSAIVQITGLVLDSGATVTAPTRKTYNALWYGDSMSEGDNTLGSAGATGDLNCDPTASFAWKSMKALDCEFGIVACGGSGYTLTSSGSNVPPFSSSFSKLWGTVARSFTSPAPNLIVLMHGYNDHGADVTASATTALAGLIAAAPNAKIIVATPFDQYYNATDHTNHIAQLNAAVAAVGSSKISRIDVSSAYNTADTSDSIHPLAYASTELIAPKFIPYLAAALYPAGTGRNYSFS